MIAHKETELSYAAKFHKQVAPVIAFDIVLHERYLSLSGTHLDKRPLKSSTCKAKAHIKPLFLQDCDLRSRWNHQVAVSHGSLKFVLKCLGTSICFKGSVFLQCHTRASLPRHLPSLSFLGVSGSRQMFSRHLCECTDLAAHTAAVSGRLQGINE